MRNKVLAGLLAAVALLGGGTAEAKHHRPAKVAAVRHATSGLAVVPLSITAANGMHRFRVEVAASSAEQEKGLMFRTAMGADEGMIFPMRPAREAAFWMKNTILPLDIVFIGPDRRIANIIVAKPYDLTPLPSAGPVIGVLELNAGRTAALGIRPGDKVAW